MNYIFGELTQNINGHHQSTVGHWYHKEDVEKVLSANSKTIAAQSDTIGQMRQHIHDLTELMIKPQVSLGVMMNNIVTDVIATVGGFFGLLKLKKDNARLAAQLEKLTDLRDQQRYQIERHKRWEVDAVEHITDLMAMLQDAQDKTVTVSRYTRARAQTDKVTKAHLQIQAGAKILEFETPELLDKTKMLKIMDSVINS